MIDSHTHTHYSKHARGTVDEVLRNLRLTPVLQLGVSYSF